MSNITHVKIRAINATGRSLQVGEAVQGDFRDWGHPLGGLPEAIDAPPLGEMLSTTIVMVALEEVAPWEVFSALAETKFTEEAE